MQYSKLKLAHSIPDSADALSICTRKLYDEIAKGQIQTFKIGKRRLISKESLRAYIADRESVAKIRKGTA
ncbi:helix-turn-helix domain-containing protein [Gammaproteobacteria bacterium]|nr:helix-turn-helix domain-containing protein [Gammaproteobacteria bacterium]